LVAQTCGRAATTLGLGRDDLAAVLGKHRTSIDRSGLNPATKEGELSLLLPRIEGLTRVANYLDALRG
jgi:hypothetical protein